MKKIFALLITVVLAFCLGFNAFADDYYADNNLIDGANVLTQDEAKEISQKIDDIRAEHGIGVYIVVFDALYDNYGNAAYPSAIAEHTLQELQFRNKSTDSPAILLLICTETRDWHLEYTDTDDKLPDSEVMSEYFLDKLGENDYYGGFMAFVEGVDNELSFPWLLNIVIAVAIGLIMGFIFVTSMKGKLKTVHFAQNAHNYVRDGSFNLEKSRDLYLYSTVTRVAKPKNNSGGGRSGGSSRSGGGKF